MALSADNLRYVVDLEWLPVVRGQPIRNYLRILAIHPLHA